MYRVADISHTRAIRYQSTTSPPLPSLPPLAVAGQVAMDVLVRRPSPLQYSLDTAHTIEVTREEDENGDFGSFGFTLLYDNPPIVGTIVPGMYTIACHSLSVCMERNHCVDFV